MTYQIAKYVDPLGSWKKALVLLGFFLCKKTTEKHFAQLKTIEMMSEKTTLSLYQVI